ncbi:MAG: hypothetical protein H6730_19090 [Deltaproteobacteria bacterium]|nr:hypothetical protein [Deltaproteobacteria bacterium]
MGLLLVLLALGALTATATVVGGLVTRHGIARQVRLLTGRTASGASMTRLVEGHLAYGEWRPIREADPGTGTPRRWRYRSVVQDIFPSWLHLFCGGLTRGDGPEGGWLLEAVTGEVVAELPIGWSVSAEGGDLCVQTAEVEVNRPPVTADARADALADALAQAFLHRGLDELEEALLTEVREHQRPEALRILCQRFSDHPEVDALRAEALEDDDPALRLEAAIWSGRAGRPALVALAGDPGLPLDLRRAAVGALGRARDLDALLELAADAPSGLEAQLAGLLAGHRDPRIEAAVLPLVASPDEALVERASDILVRQGTIAAVPALQARMQTASYPLQDSLRLTVELIQDRAGPARAGALAVVGGAPEGGEVALVEPGALSEPPEG